MLRRLLIVIVLLLVATAAGADPSPAKGAKDAKETKADKATKGDKEDKLLSGMSIVGNDEAPKSLVIVPWKSSALGDPLDITRGIDAGRQPVDKDVFMRELEYYQIRSDSKH